MDSIPGSSIPHDKSTPLQNKPILPEATPVEPSPPIYVNPDHLVATRTDDTRRMVRLLWIFAILLAALIAPTVVGKIRYAYSYNSERAKVDASLEALKHPGIIGLVASISFGGHEYRPKCCEYPNETGG